MANLQDSAPLSVPTADLQNGAIDLSQIPEKLHFNPAEALIWLEDRRMIMMSVEGIGSLRQELIESFGMEAARSLLTRFGYISGCRDAELALKLYKDKATTLDLLMAGGELHALQGIVVGEMLRSEIDVEKGICNLEFIWRNCFEDHIHTQAYGIGEDVACWIEAGHASGYLSTCMGKRILVREVECRAQGHDYCRCIAKPIEEWDDIEDELKYFDALNLKPDSVQRQQTTPSRASNSLSLQDSGPGRTSSILGASVPFNILMHKLQRVAPTNATVLLLGESGVGKSALAKEICRLSRRADCPFLEVNCAAIPEQLIESELFGVEKGAFTGATASRNGRFQGADGGTLFLDEIGTLSMTAQGKLLRVIQTGEFEPLGSSKTQRVDVRIIAATNEDLATLVKEGRFREDLFYRLNVFPVVIPPLRQRRDDIPVLLEHLMNKYASYHGKKLSGISSRALQVMLNYSWPGNIRELENVIERGIILADNDRPLSYHHLFTIDSSPRSDTFMSLNELGMLSEREKGSPGTDQNDDLVVENASLALWSEGVIERDNLSLDDIENALFIAAYKQAKGNLVQASKRLGITRAQFAYRAKKIGLA